MKFTKFATLLSFTVLAVTAFFLGCNNQPPPEVNPHLLPTQNRFNDIDEAFCAADSMLNDAERCLGVWRTGLSIRVSPTRRRSDWLMSPLDVDGSKSATETQK